MSFISPKCTLLSLFTTFLNRSPYFSPWPFYSFTNKFNFKFNFDLPFLFIFYCKICYNFISLLEYLLPFPFIYHALFYATFIYHISRSFFYPILRVTSFSTVIYLLLFNFTTYCYGFRCFLFAFCMITVGDFMDGIQIIRLYWIEG